MVSKVPKFVDMVKTPKNLDDDADDVAIQQQPMYPYGLCLYFSQDELDKLDLEDDVEVGDMIHLFCIAKVTSVSKREMADGNPDMRVEMQITHIACENENDENDDEDTQMRSRPSLYD